MVRQKAKDDETVEQFLSAVRKHAAGAFEVTGQGSAGCELTFQTSHIYYEVLENAADETGMYLDSVDFENHALRFYVEGDDE